MSLPLSVFAATASFYVTRSRLMYEKLWFRGTEGVLFSSAFSSLLFLFAICSCSASIPFLKRVCLSHFMHVFSCTLVSPLFGMDYVYSFEYVLDISCVLPLYHNDFAVDSLLFLAPMPSLVSVNMRWRNVLQWILAHVH